MIDYVKIQGCISERDHIAKGMNKFGYGSKISTEYKVKIENKWRRVYCTCFSNNASYWVIVNKQKKFLLELPRPL